jgi:hypothetical protein
MVGPAKGIVAGVDCRLTRFVGQNLSERELYVSLGRPRPQYIRSGLNSGAKGQKQRLPTGALDGSLQNARR